MLGAKLGGPAPANGSNIDGETGWEVRPGDMLVQKRNDHVQGRQDVDGSSFTIKVSHGSNLHDITVSSSSTFGDVKKIIAQEIGVEPETQKLFFRGKEKEDCDYLQMAGVKDNAKVLLAEDARDNGTSSKGINEVSEISRGSEAVAEVRAEVDTLAEQVSALQAVVNGGTKIDDKDIVYLTEMLMRELLKLDNIDAAGEGKMQRKMEVRRIQGFVEEIDTLKAQNSNPFSDCSNTVSITTEWEKFDPGDRSLTAPTPVPPTKVTQEWEQFD